MTMGLLAFHGLTILDLTGPYEVLSRAPGARVLIISGHPGELTVRCGPAGQPEPQVCLAD